MKESLASASSPVAVRRDIEFVMASVVILLGTLNGATFLPRQLRSIENQTFGNWRLIASDDGSSDSTVTLLSQFRDKHGASRVEIRDGPRQGFIANFLSLACDSSMEADFYAFCDQDDIWEPEKLARALNWLEKKPRDLPALWCGRTRLIDQADRDVGHSSLFTREPSFRNALVQSIAGANTMVFNTAARDLLAFCGNQPDLPSHDWWLYLLTTSAGGTVHYDPIPAIRYRVHKENVMGSNLGIGNRVHRLLMLARGRFKHWTDLNVKALEHFRPRMSPDNRALFDRFCRARQQNLLVRHSAFLRLGVYRQTLLGNLGLMIAAWTGRI